MTWDLVRGMFVIPEQVSPWLLAARLIASALLGCGVVGIYKLVRRDHVVTPTFPPTLVLMSILVATVTQVIGESTARAFGLVGALSIVRFRTVVEDTEDIAFVIFSVTVGMAVGSNHLVLALIGMVVVGVTAFLIQPRPKSSWAGVDVKLSVRIAVGQNPNALLQPLFEKFLLRFDLVSGGTGRQGTALDLVYKVRLRAETSPAELLDEMNRIEGIQGVELNRE